MARVNAPLEPKARALRNSVSMKMGSDLRCIGNSRPGCKLTLAKVGASHMLSVVNSRLCLSPTRQACAASDYEEDCTYPMEPALTDPSEADPPESGSSESDSATDRVSARKSADIGRTAIQSSCGRTAGLRDKVLTCIHCEQGNQRRPYAVNPPEVSLRPSAEPPTGLSTAANGCLSAFFDWAYMQCMLPGRGIRHLEGSHARFANQQFREIGGKNKGRK
ncbi:hypothetical protein B0H16DRAFT_1453995 [Mycena metata]|uniref:Uncharacterized protein n=1 Tax=Mycena metata TaxID=1033252 RepID=A0AAD7JND3_9AGAR|nr:hypothetical protein B0H16DRAFT_1453995 [Mycena metata]